MFKKYFIRNVETWLYIDKYSDIITEVPLKDVMNCIFNSKEEAMHWLYDNQNNFKQKYIIVDEIILNI